MPSISIRYDHKFRGIASIERKVLLEAGVGAYETAQAIKRYIRDNWSPPPPPSAVGDPPAVRTGNLDSSLFIERVRNVKGQFAKNGESYTAVVLTADTLRGNSPNGRTQYAEAVELYNNRPFLEPAVEEIGEQLMEAIMEKRFRIL
jgi:hypothetical protein